MKSSKAVVKCIFYQRNLKKTTLPTSTTYQLDNKMPTARQRNQGTGGNTKQMQTAPKKSINSNPTLSKAVHIIVNTKPGATWADMFDWKRMEDEIEAAASRTGDRGSYAVYLTYQKAGSMPLGSDRTYASDFFVPINLRPDVQLKWAIKKKNNRDKKKITCRRWATRTCPAYLDGVECDYNHPEDGAGMGVGKKAATKLEKAWR